MTDTTTIKLRKFDMSTIVDSPNILILGKRDTGKSFIVKDLLWYHQQIPYGTVISGTRDEFYGKMIPKRFIHDKYYDPLIISNLLKRQKNLCARILQDLKATGTSTINPSSFLILDDCLCDNTWINNDDVRYLFRNGRHVKTTFVITMSYPMGIHPVLRANVDYVFILRESIIATRRRIWEQYAGMFPDFDSFCQVLDQCTENYGCLVIDNTTSSNKFEDQVFWYKAETHPDFQMCANVVEHVCQCCGRTEPGFWVDKNMPSTPTIPGTL